MSFSINDFTSNLTYGGARPTLFKVRLSNPINAAGDAKLEFLCKATSIPASTLGTIEAPYMGRKVKLPGDRTFAEWQVTIINDEDFLIRDALEEWSNSINGHETNVIGTPTSAPSELKSQGEVIQYSKTETVLRTYQFYGIWPSEVSNIELSWESNDAIQEFTTTFQYDIWKVSGGVTGNAGQS